jgi:hypothetical protein
MALEKCPRTRLEKRQRGKEAKRQRGKKAKRQRGKLCSKTIEKLLKQIESTGAVNGHAGGLVRLQGLPGG